MILRTKRGGWGYSFPPADFEINPSSPQSRGLVTWFPFIRSETRISYKEYTRKLLLSAVGTPDLQINGQRGPTLNFDRTVPERLVASSVPNDMIPNAPVTLEAWARLTSPTTFDNNTVFSYTDTDVGFDRYAALVMVTRAADGVMRFIYQRNGSSISTGDITTPWESLYHIVGVSYSITHGALFVNGKNLAEDAATSLSFPGCDYLAIGTRVTTSALTFSNPFGGHIYDARIYNRALTDAEVWEHYTNPWELYQPKQRMLNVGVTAIAARIPRYGFTNFQIPGIV